MQEGALFLSTASSYPGFLEEALKKKLSPEKVADTFHHALRQLPLTGGIIQQQVLLSFTDGNPDIGIILLKIILRGASGTDGDGHSFSCLLQDLFTDFFQVFTC